MMLTGWYEVYKSHLDPRTKDWPLVGNIGFISTLLVSYYYFSRFAGPRWMSKREPYHLKPIIAAFNLYQILANVWYIYNNGRYTYFGGGYSFYCQGIDYSTDENAMMVLKMNYIYFFIRISDFLDTLFFVLSKKASHVSQLHVVHHMSVVYGGWYALTLGADGHANFSVIVNACVHVAMYTYYFLASMGPKVRKYLWWKRYLTQIQIIQLLFLGIHFMIPLFVDCSYPKILVIMGLPEGITILLLFFNYYYQTYWKKVVVETSCIASKSD